MAHGFSVCFQLGQSKTKRTVKVDFVRSFGDVLVRTCLKVLIGAFLALQGEVILLKTLSAKYLMDTSRVDLSISIDFLEMAVTVFNLGLGTLP